MNATKEYEHIKPWTRPDCYVGPSWDDYYVFLGRHRGSDCLAESNFVCGLKALGGEQGEKVMVIRETHWAVGWVEWSAIHKDESALLQQADDILKKLDGYPVVDEEDLSEREQEVADTIWRDCFTQEGRIKALRQGDYGLKDASLSGIASLLAVARGEYFPGYASELAYM